MVKKDPQREDTNFGEFIPAYMQSEMFSTADDGAPEDVRRSIGRQLGILVGLLVLQIALFFALIKYVLGFAL